MGLSLVPGGDPVYPNLAAFAARAAEAVADPSDGVAADPSVLDTERGTLYGYAVGHAEIVDGLSEGHKPCPTSTTPLAESALHEEWRRSFLARVQHVDPRERRP